MTDLTSSRYDGIVERTPEGGVIRFERRLDFPIRDVWDAITSPERLAEWWLPFDADITVDLREGGEIVFTATGDEPMTVTCTILRVEPPMLLEHTHVDPGSHMRWELEPVDRGCVLRLSHFVPDADAAIDRGYVVGLHASLARLEPCLAGAPIPWDWDAFAVWQAGYAALGFASEATDDER
jgi:uncharacterized protein YndB with AHSA1/START domain